MCEVRYLPMRGLLIRRWRSRRSSRGGFRRAQVSLDRILRDVEHDELVWRTRSPDVELHRFACRLVLLLDALVVGHHGQRELVFLWIDFLELRLDRTHVIRSLCGLVEREFE